MHFYQFFRNRILIARLSGIPVRIDYRWFVVLLLMSFIMAGSFQSLTKNILTSLLFGLVTTIVFFVSVLLHEIAHVYAARWENIDVIEIILYPFGGLARLRHAPDAPRAEFRTAFAGPAASFLLTLFFLGLFAISGTLGTDIFSLLTFILCLMNFLLAVFNLFPGYPLDGGRVLRAYLWKRGTDLNEATILSSQCGQIIAVALIIFGLFAVLIRVDILTGFWTILVGVFLFESARKIILEVRNFENRTVESAMRLPIPVMPETNVMHFVDRILALHRQTVFPVAKDKQLYGMLLLEDLKKLPREDWQTTKVQAVMRPITPDSFIESDALMIEANELMLENGINALGVIDEKGNLVGFLQGKKIKR